MSLLRRLRMEKGITQGELAGLLEVDASTVSFWESGKYVPHPRMIPKLSRVLGVARREIVQAIDPSENQ